MFDINAITNEQIIAAWISHSLADYETRDEARRLYKPERDEAVDRFVTTANFIHEIVTCASLPQIIKFDAVWCLSRLFNHARASSDSSVLLAKFIMKWDSIELRGRNDIFERLDDEYGMASGFWQCVYRNASNFMYRDNPDQFEKIMANCSDVLSQDWFITARYQMPITIADIITQSQRDLDFVRSEIVKSKDRSVYTIWAQQLCKALCSDANALHHSLTSFVRIIDGTYNVRIDIASNDVYFAFNANDLQPYVGLYFAANRFNQILQQAKPAKYPWTDWDGGYVKAWYDIELADGTIICECWCNVGVFSDAMGVKYPSSQVRRVRLTNFESAS